MILSDPEQKDIRHQQLESAIEHSRCQNIGDMNAMKAAYLNDEQIVKARLQYASIRIFVKIVFEPT